MLPFEHWQNREAEILNKNLKIEKSEVDKNSEWTQVKDVGTVLSPVSHNLMHSLAHHWCFKFIAQYWEEMSLWSGEEWLTLQEEAQPLCRVSKIKSKSLACLTSLLKYKDT